MAILYVAPEYFDAAGLAAHRTAFEDLAQVSSDIIIDMKAVKHLDSTGLGALSFLKKRLQQVGHRMQLIHVEGQPARFLQKLELQDTFR